MTNFWLFLLICAKFLGESSADEPLEKVFAFVGFPATLPCLQKLSRDAEVPTIEWSKRGLNPQYVFVYRQNFEVYAEKHPDFEFRTHLFMMKLHHGNFSMRLSNVRRNDTGVYVCKTIWNKDKQDVREVQLVVEELPKPELSVVWSQNGSVDVSCEAQACFPVVLTILDDRGNVLEAEETVSDLENSSVCYSVKQKTSVKPDMKSVVCRVESSEVKHSRERRMLLPGLAEGCGMFPVVGGILTCLAILILVGLGLLIYNRCRRSSENATLDLPPTDELRSNVSERSHLLNQDGMSTVIEIPEEAQNTLTQQPDLLFSTPDSICSNRSSKNRSVFSVFPEEADANGRCNGVVEKPATCEINVASETVNFNNAKQGKNQTNGISAKASLPNFTKNQTNSTSKSASRRCPLGRSRSESDSSVRTSLGGLKNIRRHSFSGKFEKLTEENPEQEL